MTMSAQTDKKSYESLALALVSDPLAFRMGHYLSSVIARGDSSYYHTPIEPLRRMCKWIVNESSDPEILPLWSRRSKNAALTG